MFILCVELVSKRKEINRAACTHTNIHIETQNTHIHTDNHYFVSFFICLGDDDDDDDDSTRKLNI